MKKVSLGMMLLLFTLISLPCLAQTVTASASMPTATGISISITPVDSKGTAESNDDVWGSPLTSLTPDFGTLEEVSGTDAQGHSWVFFGSKTYFAIDIAWAGGAAPSAGTIQFTYDPAASSSPPGLPAGDNGLADRTTLTFAKTELLVWPTTTLDTLLGLGKMKMSDLNGTTVTSADIAGGWLRIYFGIATGDRTAIPPEPAGTKTFSPADPAGTYTGVFTVSFTIS